MERRPYLLRPDRPPEGEPRRLFDGETETELSPAAQERARAVGLVMRRPQWSPNTILAHEATLYAREKGLDGDLHHALARAYWELRADLSSPEIFGESARRCGPDRAEVAPRLRRRMISDLCCSTRSDERVMT